MPTRSMTASSRGLSRASRGRSEIVSTTSMPSVTRPNTVCFPSSHGHASAVTTKNCDPIVPFGSLRDTIRDHGPLPPAQVARIGLGVLAGLRAAHEAGVVHRDVKPANILLSWEGDVKLADFGIAFAVERAERTQTGVAKGTPGYMAPEQLLGGGVDARADVFALGCTLHALAYGETPLA